jgi:hypothetical protein
MISELLKNSPYRNPFYKINTSELRLHFALHIMCLNNKHFKVIEDNWIRVSCVTSIYWSTYRQNCIRSLHFS